MITAHVIEWRDLAITIEREPTVRHGHVDDAAGTKNAQMILERADRVLAVLDHVVCDHEIDRLVWETTERFAVIDDVRGH